MKLPTLASIKTKVAEAKKGIAAVAGVAAGALALGFLHGTAEDVALAVVAVGTVLGVYNAPNTPSFQAIMQHPIYQEAVATIASLDKDIDDLKSAVPSAVLNAVDTPVGGALQPMALNAYAADAVPLPDPVTTETAPVVDPSTTTPGA